VRGQRLFHARGEPFAVACSIGRYRLAHAIAKGIELLDERPGDGPVAAKGAVVIYNLRLFLRRGDEVTPDARSIEAYRDQLSVRRVEGVELIDHTTTLGKRRPIPGVEKTLYGMQPGGYREVRVSPHLGYGEAGLGELIPANALLRIQLWVRDVKAAAGGNP
jgi:hypothetical protein